MMVLPIRYPLIVALLACAVCEVIANDAAIDVGDRKQVFLDGTFVGSSRNIELTMNRPRRTGEVLIRPDMPWETASDKAMVGVYSSILKDGDKIRVWYDLIAPTGPGPYDHTRRVCYAESDDGIHFTKPKLGIYEVDGSKENNVVLPGVIGGCSVWIDPKSPAEERYKTQAKVYPSGQLHMHASPDGLHWKQFANLKIGPGGWDTQTVVFWDPSIEHYAMYTRRWVRSKEDKTASYRTVRRLESEDLTHWTNESTVLEADETDHATYDTPTAEPPVDFYGATVFKLPDADRAYVMLAEPFWHFARTKDGGNRLGPSTFEVQLAVSRDGKTFQRSGGRRPFMRPGPAGSFDSRWVWAMPNPIRMGNEIWIYYVGANRDHNDHLDPAAPGGNVLSGISRAVMRLDGFVSADAPYEGGEFTTPAICFEGNRLELNVDTGGGGSVRVELLDAEGMPIRRFTAADATLLTGNAVSLPVTWGERSDVAELANRPIKIRFLMRDCKLYAFQFRELTE